MYIHIHIQTHIHNYVCIDRYGYIGHFSFFYVSNVSIN